MRGPIPKKVGVLGAAGSMGRGICSLLAREYGILFFQDNQPFFLFFADSSLEGLLFLKTYLKRALLRYGEKNIVFLRKIVRERVSVVSNKEVIDTFIETIFDRLFFSLSPSHLLEAEVVFEAITEDLSKKASALSLFQGVSCTIFSNTSSIPIQTLGEKSGLSDRLMGFHFYNPPEMQKLIELIPSKTTSNEVFTLAERFVFSLGKESVVSADSAGFIGNGFFLRHAAHCFSLLSRFASIEEGVCALDEITETLLIRPMGIFRLLDFVGLDIASSIMEIMHLPIPPQLSSLLKEGRKGGKDEHGKQRSGFFSYKEGRKQAIFSFVKGEDEPLPKETIKPLVEGSSYKQFDSLKSKEYVDALKRETNKGAQLALELLEEDLSIVSHLVEEGIAKTKEDVWKVLSLGFHHKLNLLDLS